MTDLREAPLPIANTLIVPGCIDEQEVRLITRNVASISPEYTLQPSGLLPSRLHARSAPDYPDLWPKDVLRQHKKEGLQNIRLGIIHLLGPG
jgi:pyruvate formate lyase activating enzyme